MNYKEEIIKAMELLAQNPRVIVIGQNVRYPGAIAIEDTLQCFSRDRRIEVPLIEDAQLGMAVGLALSGAFLPLTVYPRMDFLIIAANQLVNHLDKMEQMSCGQYCPKVIIRTGIGTRYPLDPGPQHYQDHTEALRHILTNVSVVKLEEAEQIVPAYRKALKSNRSTILIEIGQKMRE